MNLFLNIIDRFNIHFWASAGVVLAVLLTLTFLKRKVPQVRAWLPEKFEATLVISGILVCLGAFSREAWDVHKGQSVIKAFTDYQSWLLGCGTWVVVIHRLKGWIIDEVKKGTGWLGLDEKTAAASNSQN